MSGFSRMEGTHLSRTRASVVVVHNEKLLLFRAEDPTSHRQYLFLPGGVIEADETAPEAAERETLEETGFQVRVDPLSAIDREYFFEWDGKQYDCLTIFYRAELLNPFPRPVNDQPYNLGAHWIPLSEVPELLSYSEDIRSAVIDLLESRPSP